MSLQDSLIRISEKGFLTTYHVDTEDSTYSNISVIDIDFLAENEMHEFHEAYDLFEKVKVHLKVGTYFSVFKDSFGCEYWTTKILPEQEQKKIDKDLKRKQFISKYLSWFRKHGDTIIILMTIIAATLWIKLSF